jgi:hypothetical protein
MIKILTWNIRSARPPAGDRWAGVTDACARCASTMGWAARTTDALLLELG